MVLTRTLYGEEAAKRPDLLPEQDKERIRTLSSAVAAVVGGVAGSRDGGGNAVDVLANAQVGGVVGRNAVENNHHLTVNEHAQAQREIRACATQKDPVSCRRQVARRWELVASRNQWDLYAACDKGLNTPDCVSRREAISRHNYGGKRDYHFPTGVQADFNFGIGAAFGFQANSNVKVSVGNRGAIIQFEGGAGVGVGWKANLGKENQEQNSNSRVERSFSMEQKIIEGKSGSQPDDKNATLGTQVTIEGNVGPLSAAWNMYGGRQFDRSGKSSLFKGTDANVSVKTQLGVGGMARWDIIHMRTRRYGRYR